MKAIIVDDEQPLLNEFQKMLGQYSQLKVVGAYTNPLKALEEIDEVQPDVAFLDIEMRGLNGLELAERLLGKLPELDIFFVTSYNHYATEAFDTNAIDYILKPVRPERLQKALERLNKKRGVQPGAGERKGLGPGAGEKLRIQSFGKFGISVGNEMIKWSRAKHRELLAYLLQHEGKWIDKYKLCDDLWRSSAPGQALSHLQTAVWAVRKVLKENGVTCIKIEFLSDSYILKLEEADWDLREFNTAVKSFNETGNVKYRKKARELYKDGYLYNDDWLWAMLEREAYSRVYDRLTRPIKI